MRAALAVTAARLLAVREPKAGDAIPCADSENVLFVDRSTGLTRIKRDVVQLAVWRRPEIPPFVRALSDPSFSAADLPSFKGVVTPSDAARTLGQALRAQEGRRRDALGASGALDAGQLDALVEDVARLVGLFAKVSGEEYVVVRLEALEDNGCVFWHQDCVDFRLCATYRGPCTEFVAPEWSKAVLRRRQADSKHAQSLMHTDVALFKGRGEDHRDEAPRPPRDRPPLAAHRGGGDLPLGAGARHPAAVDDAGRGRPRRGG